MSNVVPVHSVIPAALADILRRAPLTPEKVSFAWRQAAGSAVDRATMVELRESVLVIRARDRAWQKEVMRARTELLRRIARILGDGVVRTLDVVVAESPERPPGPVQQP